MLPISYLFDGEGCTLETVIRLLARLVIVLALLASLFASAPSQAQSASRTFTETGKTVGGRFLEYWDTHGGLAQQGYPISEEMQEVSETDGKSYIVQYFERAVFEKHPENAPPSDVLLSLLGVFVYQQKYPGGAPGQTPNAQTNSRLFPETGHKVGGIFLDYWTGHGGLAQQGYPLSEEFTEVSPLDGKVYKVQYFERAVFELHPEFAGTPNEVLLSQLGTFRYGEKYLEARATPTSTFVPAPTATPVSGGGGGGSQPTPTVAAAPPPPYSDCSEAPAGVDMTVTPNCSARGYGHTFQATGFFPGDLIHLWLTDPEQRIVGSLYQQRADGDGKFTWQLSTNMSWQSGIWALTMEGQRNHKRAIGYLKLIVPGIGLDCSAIPQSSSMTVVPRCAPAGVAFEFEGSGFQPGETVGRYYTTPTGDVIPGSSHSIADAEGKVKGIVLSTGFTSPVGIWAGTFEGTESRHKATAYFKVTPTGPFP